MSKYDFSDFDEPKAKYDFSDFDEKPKAPEYDYSNVGQVAKDLTKAATIDGLPVYGQAIGSTIGTIGGPQGRALGGGLGQAAGESLRQGLYKVGELITGERPLSDEFRLPTKEEVAQVVNNTNQSFIEGATSEAGGEVAGKLIQSGAKAIKSVGKSSKEAAEELYARSLGLDKPRAKQIGDAQDIRDVGRFARENKIITPFASAESMTAKNEAVKKKGGEMMGDVYKQIDDAGASTFNPLETAADVDKKLGGFYRSPINKGETAQLENMLESIVMRGDKSIPLKEAQILKQEIKQVANFKKNPLELTPKEKMAQEAYFIISKNIDSAAEAGSKTIGKEGLEKVLTEGKKIYSKAKDVEKLLINKSTKDSNNILGLTDFVVGAAGLGASYADPQSTPYAIAALVGKKYLGKYGAQQAGIILDKLSQGILKNPAVLKLAKESPKAFEKLITSTISGMSVDPAPKKGVEKWIANGQQRVIETDSSLDPQFLERYQKSKDGRNDLIRAGELKPKSNQMNQMIEKIKTSEEYKKYLKEKEKQAQGKEPNQSSVKPQIKFPLVVQKDGFTAVVRNAQEFDEAKGEGWA